MKAWTMRILGALNILFGVADLYYFTWMVSIHWNKWPASASVGDWEIFWALLVLSLTLIGYQVHCGIELIKKKESSLLPTCILFAAQSVLFFLSVWVLWILLPLSMSNIIFGLWEVALSPLDPHLLVGYPSMAAIVTLILLILRRKSGRNSSEGLTVRHGNAASHADSERA